MKSFRLLCVLTVLLLAGAGRPAQAQRFAWLQNQLGGSNAIGNSATNATGYTLVSLFYSDSLLTSQGRLYAPVPGPLVGNLRYAVALLLYDPQGGLVWLQNVADGEWIEPGGCALDNANNAYVTANRRDTLTFHGQLALGITTKLLKYDGTGQLQWSRTVADAPGGAGMPGVGLDAAGNCYFAGTAFDQDSVAGFPVDTAGRVLNYVGKCNPNGQFQWLQQIRNPLCNWQNPNTWASNLHVSPAGECVVTGALGNVTTFGTGPNATVVAAGSRPERAFVARYSTMGTLRWVSTQDATGPIGEPNFTAGLADSTATYVTGNSPFGFHMHGQPVGLGLFVAKLDVNGQLLWAQTTSCTTPGATFATELAVDARHRLYLTGATNETCLFGTHVLERGGAFVAQLDTQGLPQWVVVVPMLGINRLRIGEADQLYALGGNNELGATPVGPHTAYGYGTYLLKIDSRVNTLTGSAYLDLNANGQRDPGEGAFPRTLGVVEVNQNQYAATHPVTGRFTAYAGQGAYNLRLPRVPRHYQLSQGSSGYQRSFTGYAETDSARHFGLAPIPNQPDLRVTLTPYTPTRRGYATRYRLRIENIGTVGLANVPVSVTLDAAAQVVGGLPAPITQTGQTLAWTVAALAPFETRDFDVTFTVPLNVAVGAGLTSTAETPGYAPAILTQTVVSSCDPNDITVNFSTLTAAQIAAEEPLDYVVRFQNMGTDTAFAVVIQDTLPAGLLQLGTIELLSQSHNVQWSLSGPGLLTIRFPGIELPQQAVDAVRSQGFVRFRIVPRTTLGAGTLIPNRAHIFFDFNNPVPTNEATTLVQNPTGLPRETGAATWSLYPNPATSRVTLTAEVPAAGAVQVVITDALGRPVRRESVAAPAGEWRHALSVAGLTPGFYAVRLTLPGGAGTSRRLVVR